MSTDNLTPEQTYWAKQRADLTSLGGWDNSLYNVPAGGVRELIQEGERHATKIAELEQALKQLYSVVVRQNQIGAEWHTDLFDDLMAALAISSRLISTVQQELEACKRATTETTDVDKQTIEQLTRLIGMAYGHLWHVNNEPGTPAQYSPGRASMQARHILRDALTNEQRGFYINAIREALQAEGMNVVGECKPLSE